MGSARAGTPPLAPLVQEAPLIFLVSYIGGATWGKTLSPGLNGTCSLRYRIWFQSVNSADVLTIAQTNLGFPNIAQVKNFKHQIQQEPLPGTRLKRLASFK
eukprot:28783-Amphidinium_carterae.1